MIHCNHSNSNEILKFRLIFFHCTWSINLSKTNVTSWTRTTLHLNSLFSQNFYLNNEKKSIETLSKSILTRVFHRSLFRLSFHVYGIRCHDDQILHLFSIHDDGLMQPRLNHPIECDLHHSRSSNNWLQRLLRTKQLKSILTLINPWLIRCFRIPC